jgi:hypothetical protein
MGFGFWWMAYRLTEMIWEKTGLRLKGISDDGLRARRIQGGELRQHAAILMKVPDLLKD